jgi:multidrug efflux pump subunit AcrA (membrane-fusion protein)
MNIITGTGRMKVNKIYFLLFSGAFILFIFILGCGTKVKETEQVVTPKANVVVTTVDRGGINDTIFLSATTVYNRKTAVLSPISGYVTKVNVVTGNMVGKGAEIFNMVTKEYKALNSSRERIDSNSYRYLLGKITINAPAYGQITDLTAQDGMYVQEGNPLCTIVNVADLNLNLFVPVEYSGYFTRGQVCTIILPNEQRISGRIMGLLSKAESNTQSETYLLKPYSSILIPEGINVKVYTVLQKRNDTQLLPKDAVLANETLDKFWVMKLINDSTAVKVPVRVGLSSKENVEVIDPKFSSEDRIIITGNYGLPDTALINVQPETNEK